MFIAFEGFYSQSSGDWC